MTAESLRPSLPLSPPAVRCSRHVHKLFVPKPPFGPHPVVYEFIELSSCTIFPPGDVWWQLDMKLSLLISSLLLTCLLCQWLLCRWHVVWLLSFFLLVREVVLKSQALPLSRFTMDLPSTASWPVTSEFVCYFSKLFVYYLPVFVLFVYSFIFVFLLFWILWLALRPLVFASWDGASCTGHVCSVGFFLSCSASWANQCWILDYLCAGLNLLTWRKSGSRSRSSVCRVSSK